MLVSDEIADAITGDGFPMGFTYNGHPTSCAVALANLDVIEREGLLERARETGAYILERLAELRGPADRRRGPRRRDDARRRARRRPRDPEPSPMDAAPQDVIRRETGVIVRDCGHNLVISPPLVMTESEARRLVDATRDVLSRLAPDGTFSDG